MRHAHAMMYVRIANPRWRVNSSQHSRRMRNPQFNVTGKRPMINQLPGNIWRLKVTISLSLSQGSRTNLSIIYIPDHTFADNYSFNLGTVFYPPFAGDPGLKPRATTWSKSLVIGWYLVTSERDLFACLLRTEWFMNIVCIIFCYISRFRICIRNVLGYFILRTVVADNISDFKGIIFFHHRNRMA